jgi:two-component system response regulator PilR (NtrC family)
MVARILIVDDELSMREFLAILLEREGYFVDTAASAELAIAQLVPGNFDLVISDVNMPGLSGFDVLDHVTRQCVDTSVLLVTAYSTTEKAVEAMKLGAYDYIAKPFKVEEIKVLVKNALEKKALQRENERLRQEVTARHSFSGIIGKSKVMQEVYRLIEKVSASAASVIVRGESGTGKELVARAIHYAGQRKSAPFVAINCSAIPETLMESELFGYRRGAFTGAAQDRAGLFEQANGGTLFLDEIGELSLNLQAKLLRVLQEREVRRVGAADVVRVDVRVVAASNRDLEQLAKAGAFREDLYFRLNVIEVFLPPLRDRVEDIPLLIEHFYRRYAGEGAWGPEVVTPEALQVLLEYPYPGNVRELENSIERAVVLGGRVIDLGTLPPAMRQRQHSVAASSGDLVPATGVQLEQLLDTLERQYLEAALTRAQGVKKQAAALLGLTFRSFRYRLAKFGMDDE